jgi:hypothetical protein
MEMDEATSEKGTGSMVADDAAAVAAMPWSAPSSSDRTQTDFSVLAEN